MKVVRLPQVDRVGPGSSAMVLFPAGSYTVGSAEGSAAEGPVRAIELDRFWLDESLVTNEQFAMFAEDCRYVTQAERDGRAWGWYDGSYQNVAGLSWRSHAVPGRERHPVVLVSWYDASAYAQWAGKRLPTEWEWEAAAASGTRTRYPWGDASPGQAECNWHKSPSCPPPTSEVLTFPANAAGLFDMVGNVWQWCENLFDGNDENALPLRARRGGAWNVIQDFRLRCTNRGAMKPDAVAPNLGFRCAADLK